jgi:hypothetical protein
MYLRLHTKLLGVFITVLLSVPSIIPITSDCSAQQAIERRKPQPQPDPKWKSDVLENTDAFLALFKHGTTGGGPPEVRQWGAFFYDDDNYKPGGGDERIAQLRTAIKEYPKSPYADAAALLLARAYYLYEGNEEKAISGLHDVIKDYPDGDWIAEDPIMRQHVFGPLIGGGKAQMVYLTRPEIKGMSDAL